MTNGLKNGDSWDAQMELTDQWSAAGGTANMKIAAPLARMASAMEKRLRRAGIPHPLEDI